MSFPAGDYLPAHENQTPTDYDLTKPYSPHSVPLPSNRVVRVLKVRDNPTPPPPPTQTT